MTNGESENLVAAVADRVREALVEAEQRGNEFVEEAERRAEEILADAQAQAERIVADAEAEAERKIALAEGEARERVERAREALEELGVALAGEAPAPEAANLDDERAPEHEELDEAPEPVAQDVEPEREELEAPGAQPVPAPVAEEAEPEDEAQPEPEAKPEEPAESSPSTDELIAQLRAGAGAAAADTGGDAAARLVAMNMALDGASREEVQRHLAEGYEVGDPDALLDEVFSRVSG